MMDQVLIAGFVALLGTAAVSDYRAYRIPNSLCALIAILWLVHALVTVMPLSWLASLSAAAVLFLIGAAMFAAGWMGGGDVKLMAAVALWTGWADMPLFLVVTALSGGLLAMGTLISRRLMRPAAAGGATAIAKEGMPYGIAIALGGIAVGLDMLVL